MRLRLGLTASRMTRVLALFVGAMLALGAQCAGDPSVTCEVELPASIAGSAQWMEVGVLPGSCPPLSELAGGLPITGLITRVAFQKGDTSPPPIGSLRKAAYAFAAVARAANCSVLASGCAQVDLTNARDIPIALTATTAPAGACAAGESCIDSRCVPALGGPDAAVPRCSMTFVGAGPLGDPLGLDSEVVSAPAAVAAGTGFLVAYREYDPAGGTAQLSLVSIAAGGGLTIATPKMLSSQCAGQDETDAVGMDFNGATGIIVSARPGCGSQAPGFDAFQVDGTGKVSMSVFTSPAPMGGQPVLSSHAVALTGGGGGWLAYGAKGKATVMALSGLFPNGAPVTFDPAPSRTLTSVAASAQTVALLAGGTGGAADSGVTGSGLDLAIGASPSTVSPLETFSGTWGAVALAGTRAVVLSDSTVSTQPLAWHVIDPPPAAPSSATFAPGGSASGAATGGDVAVRGDLVFFAAEEQDSVSLDVFDHASTTPTFVEATPLATDPRVPSQAGVRDGKIAVAASASQVLVTWVRGTALGPSEPVGAWALYACGP